MTRKEEREQAAWNYIDSKNVKSGNEQLAFGDFINGAEWADSTAWKSAGGDNLPEIDKEVIALAEVYDHYMVLFAHRPNPNGDAICYDEGGWNQPNVKWWLDLELPKKEE